MSWIKIRTDLRDHPKIVRMASALKADRLRILGGLQIVWGIFDTHSTDGLLEGYTLATIDEETWKGFGAAMQQIRWLEETDDGLIIPEFDIHNGASAKKRAQDTKLKKSNRAPDKSANGSWTANGHLSGDEADIDRTRVELDKRKNKTPIAPKGADCRFDRFWQAYPSKVGKDAARKAFEKRKPDDGLVDEMVAAIGRQRDSAKWRKDDGQYIPNPATWLNEGRWQDEITDSHAANDVFAGAH